MRSYLKLIFISGLLVLLSGCATIKLGPSFDKPLQQQVLEQGSADHKILVLTINGFISDSPKPGLFAKKPSMVDSLVMQLNRAEKDTAIKAVVLKINTPGGGVTSSDILFHELQQFKQRTNKKIIVQMMGLATSGGVYLSLVGDHIQAHPTTITGSVGVIAVTADLSDTMEKIGAKVNVYKSGANKDMGSPFREPSDTDQQHFSSMVEQMAERFYAKLEQNRQLTAEQLVEIKSAQIYTGAEAKNLGMVDSLGYLSDALDKACEMVEQSNCQVVGYRFNKNPNVTAYSPTIQSPENVQFLNLPMLNKLNLQTGLYYLYLQ